MVVNSAIKCHLNIPQVEMFDTTTEIWTVVRNEPTDPVLDTIFSFVRDNRFYFLGGKDVAGNFQTSVQYFDTDTNDWVTVGNLPMGASKAVGFFYNK